jgi:hypothetical protein
MLAIIYKTGRPTVKGDKVEVMYWTYGRKLGLIGNVSPMISPSV